MNLSNLSSMRRLAFCLACALFGAAGQGDCAGISVQPWGVHQGQPVERVTLENERGMRLAYIDYGATLVAADVADRRGRRRNIILGLPDLPAYERTRRRFAAVIGRYAGRIAGAQFTLDGKTFKLFANQKGVALHGDPDGYDKRVWRRQDYADAESIGSIYRLVSPDGDQRFPGTLKVSVTYRLLRKRDEFQVEYTATTDAPTVVNLTNHAYFNLAGAGAAGLATQRFQINADRYLETDNLHVPSGRLLSVAGTPLDFRRPASMTARLAAPSAMLGNPPGIDHSLVFSGPAGKPKLVATVDDAASGRRMEIRSTEPSVQLYSAGGFDGSETGAEGRAYLAGDGFAFETQHFPDSPNHPEFPTTALYPGQVLHALTSYRFMRLPRPAAAGR